MPTMTRADWNRLPLAALYPRAWRRPDAPSSLDALLDNSAKAATWGAFRGYWVTIRADTGKPHLFKPGRIER